MSQVRFNHVFLMLMALGIACAFFIPPTITDRAKGKADLLLYPIVQPTRAIAGWFSSKYGSKPLPAGETRVRPDSELLAENQDLRQQVAFLVKQLEDLKLVEDERRRLGPLLNYFKPVTVGGGDATPGRESLSIMPASGINTLAGTPVMCPDGVAGRLVESGRVRLVTDPGFTTTCEFGRYGENKWIPLEGLKASVKGAGGGTMKVEHLTFKEVDGIVKPGDWVVIADNTWPAIMQNRPVGQVESVGHLAAKPLFAEIIIKPRTDLRRLREVLIMRK